MKSLTLLIFVLFIACNQKPEFVKAKLIKSQVDNISTSLQVENYIRKIDTNLNNFKVKRFQDMFIGERNLQDSISRITADSLKINQSFYKADFDNNGYTDLLFFGQQCSTWRENTNCNFGCAVVLNYGENKLSKIVSIQPDQDTYIVPKPIFIDKQPLIEIYKPSKFSWPDKEKYASKNKITLIYKFDEFIEYSKKDIEHNIEKIEFTTSGCYGTCPVFELTLMDNHIGIFKPHRFNFSDDYENAKEEKGILKSKIDENTFNQIFDILNYIDFENLKDDYSVSWTDDQGSTLKITYDNGKVKTISDYGMVGSYGLKRLYKLLYDLRFNQAWK